MERAWNDAVVDTDDIQMVDYSSDEKFVEPNKEKTWKKVTAKLNGGNIIELKKMDKNGHLIVLVWVLNL